MPISSIFGSRKIIIPKILALSESKQPLSTTQISEKIVINS
jgi:hypothetical protein